MTTKMTSIALLALVVGFARPATAGQHTLSGTSGADTLLFGVWMDYFAPLGTYINRGVYRVVNCTFTSTSLAQNDVVIFDAGDDDDLIWIASSAWSTVPLGGFCGGGYTNDYLAPITSVGWRNIILAGDGDDAVLGSDQRDDVYGGPGADSIEGYGGVDHICGGGNFNPLDMPFECGTTAGDCLDGDDDICDGGNGDDEFSGAVGGVYCTTVDGGAGDDDCGFTTSGTSCTDVCGP